MCSAELVPPSHADLCLARALGLVQEARHPGKPALGQDGTWIGLKKIIEPVTGMVANTCNPSTQEAGGVGGVSLEET